METTIDNPKESVSVIPLTKGAVTIVDTKNLHLLCDKKWSLGISHSPGYAKRSEKAKTIYMHRVILDAPDGSEVDHVNGNGLDNREANLRLCSRSENQHNSRKHKIKSSRFKGVDWNTARQCWRVRIGKNNKNIYIGKYHDEVRAAQAYDKKAVELFGEFANINFPSQKAKLISEKNQNENAGLS